MNSFTEVQKESISEQDEIKILENPQKVIKERNGYIINTFNQSGKPGTALVFTKVNGIEYVAIFSFKKFNGTLLDATIKAKKLVEQIIGEN